MSPVIFDSLTVVISTHYRHESLKLALAGWANSLPNYQKLYILAHHPQSVEGVDLPDRCEVIHTGRIPEHQGCMAKTWNAAMMWAFRDLMTEWLLCSMDDIEISPGWVPLLEKYPADLYSAPAGDLAFFMNRRVLREVGWFDERFTGIGHQEWDWQARCIKKLGIENVSIQDAHGWSHNPIGLNKYWAHVGGGAVSSRTTHGLPHTGEWLSQKWNIDVPGGFIGMLQSGQIKDPPTPEIEWYPWFPRSL